MSASLVVCWSEFKKIQYPKGLRKYLTDLITLKHSIASMQMVCFDTVKVHLENVADIHIERLVEKSCFRIELSCFVCFHWRRLFAWVKLLCKRRTHSLAVF